MAGTAAGPQPESAAAAGHIPKSLGDVVQDKEKLVERIGNCKIYSITVQHIVDGSPGKVVPEDGHHWRMKVGFFVGGEGPSEAFFHLLANQTTKVCFLRIDSGRSSNIYKDIETFHLCGVSGMSFGRAFKSPGRTLHEFARLCEYYVAHLASRGKTYKEGENDCQMMVDAVLYWFGLKPTKAIAGGSTKGYICEMCAPAEGFAAAMCKTAVDAKWVTDKAEAAIKYANGDRFVWKSQDAELARLRLEVAEKGEERLIAENARLRAKVRQLQMENRELRQ